MSFPLEPPLYHKGILTDLQGAWILLRDSIAESAGFPGADRALLHVDEAMSWEVVRQLQRMGPLLLFVRNICIQGSAPSEVLDNIESVNEILNEVLEELRQGTIP